MRARWLGNLFLVLSLLPSEVLSAEQFQEQLTLRPLRDGKLAAHFLFTTLLGDATPREPDSLSTDDESQHYTLFPLALGQILREYAVTELHLTLNAGNWGYDRWGYPEEPGVSTGAELWAWMGDGAAMSVDQRWQGLRNALAGLFCASLGSLDEQRTTSPVITFQPEGSLPNWTYPHQLRHATLPSEHVCTENLTPFLKLLPCKSLSGIAALLNPHRLFDADWHGLGVHVLYRQDAGVEVRLTFQAILDPVRLSYDRRRDWSFRSVFDRAIDQACPVARSSLVRVKLPVEQSYTIVPVPTSMDDEFATFDIRGPLDVSMQWPEETSFQYPLSRDTPSLLPLSIRRTLKASTQYEAQLSLVVKNNLPTEVKTSYLEAMPWLLQFYLHTLHVECDGVSRDDLAAIVSYIAPVPHSRPSLMQVVLTLPPKSTLQLTMDVSKPFLRYTEHPPDAQRGWDLPPAVFVPFSFGNKSSGALDSSLAVPKRSTRIYTPILLVDLATPDFSMPYNVIMMSCTLVALIFGMVFNLLTRKLVVVHVGEEPRK
ncbi:Gpi16 subunit GPI transamidase component [Laetiporus sulphureus 93-53]|uniref:Gpi16 subunit GPI transamidase component n=1 Tax=Laetiporus sulphureus 93-53 TaxID=1314785 RepID=A0A165HVM1_9APHY|nr:Gpi16 subunit GPI transamidase component [Laetiporus sulphureus 93-53]KZT12249.1 Gpi16 subunit GPI transamidase component [Laetiporus sulphureus 93-53]